MPGTLPNTSFAQVTVNSNYATRSTAMDSGKVQRIGLDGHYYSFTVNYPSLTILQAKEVSGFLAGQRGSLNNFEMTIPTLSTSAGAVEDKRSAAYAQFLDSLVDWDHHVYSINFNTNVITYRVYMPGDETEFTNPSTNPSTYYIGNSSLFTYDGAWFNVGDYVNFANHTKSYQIVSSVNPVWIGTVNAEDTNGDPILYNGWTAVYEGSITVSPSIVLTDVAQWSNTTINYRDVAFRVFLTDPNIAYAAGVGNDTAMTLNVREET
jgi:hypothetical protein